MCATKSVVHLDGSCGDVLLTTFWYALTLALHTHTAHARDAGCDDTTVGAADGGLYYIFGSNQNVTVTYYSPTYSTLQKHAPIGKGDARGPE